MTSGTKAARASACAGVAGLCLALASCASGVALARMTGSVAMLAAGDRNRDGALDRSEVVTLLDARVPARVRGSSTWRAARAAALLRLFAADRNRDGRLSPAELSGA